MVDKMNFIEATKLMKKGEKVFRMDGDHRIIIGIGRFSNGSFFDGKDLYYIKASDVVAEWELFEYTIYDLIHLLTEEKDNKNGK